MGANVAELVNEQAWLWSASSAIITHDQGITYGQLSIVIGVFERHLRRHGVTPGQCGPTLPKD